MLTREELPFSFGQLNTSNYIWLTLTNLCNIHCKYCFNYVSQCNEHMSPKLAVNIIKSQLLSLDKKRYEKFYVTYFGGEPTLNSAALMDSVNFLLENDVHCRQCLMTNGVISEKNLSPLLGKSIDFQLSFDGKDNNLRFNKKVNKPILNETIETIKKLTTAKEQVTIRATIHQQNVKNMAEIVRFCASYGVSNLQFAPICEFGDAKANAVQQPGLEEYIEQLNVAYQLSKDYGVSLDLRSREYFQRLKKNKMKIPLVWLPDGYVAMTITYATSKAKGAEKIIIGTFNEVEEKIELNQFTIAKMTHNFVKNKQKYCDDCPIRDLCGGNIQFTPFATNTFEPKRDRYFCKLAIKTVAQFHPV